MRHGDAEAAAAAFAAAAHVVALDLVNQRLAPTPMEPRSRAGQLRRRQRPPDAAHEQPDAHRRARHAVPRSSAWPTEQVRVLVGDVGGGFGMKTGVYPEDIVVAYAPRTLQRPVKWVAERSEEFLSAMPRPRHPQPRRAGARRQRPRARRCACASLANVGAYATTTGVAIQLLIGPWVLDQHLRHPDHRLQAARRC